MKKGNLQDWQVALKRGTSSSGIACRLLDIFLEVIRCGLIIHHFTISCSCSIILKGTKS